MIDYIRLWLIDRMDHPFYSIPDNLDFDACVEALNDAFDDQIVSSHLEKLLTEYLKEVHDQ